MQFLMGLDDMFGFVRSLILTTDPLPMLSLLLPPCLEMSLTRTVIILLRALNLGPLPLQQGPVVVVAGLLIGTTLIITVLGGLGGRQT